MLDQDSFHRVTQRKTLNKCPASSCTELIYTARQDSHACNFLPFLPVTVLVLPVYLILAICTVFHNLFSFPRSIFSIAILFVMKLGLKTVWKLTHMLLNLSSESPTDAKLLEHVPQAGATMQGAGSCSGPLISSPISQGWWEGSLLALDSVLCCLFGKREIKVQCTLFPLSMCHCL